MDSSDSTRDFKHPYEAYAIQVDFMNGVYDCIEQGRVGIFESPTGTGKSLSLICGSLAWLRDHKRQRLSEEVGGDSSDEDDVPAWMSEGARRQKKAAALQRRADLRNRLAKIRATEAKSREQSGEPLRKRVKANPEDKPGEEDEFLLADYDSDREKAASTNGLSVKTQALLTRLSEHKADDERDDASADSGTKIFFCSRTHSQLSQFVGELQGTAYSKPHPRSPEAEEDEVEVMLNDAVKHVSLGSRKTLCINPKVSRLASNTAINERCLELQQSSTAESSRCKLLPGKDNQHLVDDFRDYTMARVRDIEDLGKLGKRLGVCPYYASRAAVEPSDIVTLPYPLLLQKSAREALSLSVRGHVVIIDEAHNLMDSITGVHTVIVSLGTLQEARSQLLGYLRKFRNRLKGKNRVYVAQVARLLDSMIGALSTLINGQKNEGQIRPNDLTTGNGADQINIYKLVQYLHESKLARKVEGYSEFEKAKQPKKQQHDPGSTAPALTHAQDFFLALANPEKDGAFFWSRTAPRDDRDGSVTLKYMLLNPREHFKDIVTEARAVILAGGTMAPMSDFTDDLFGYVDRSRLQTLSCGHVIPDSNLLAMTLQSGPRLPNIQFTFEKRNAENVILDLGETVAQAAAVIPDGLVVFLPSYAYLDQVTQVWRQRGHGAGSLWDRLDKQKRIFQEPSSKTTASEADGKSKRNNRIDELLSVYKSQIHNTDDHRGALLLAVVGGSLSEGINFSDRLGRGVIVVGLPFPNAHSQEWQAKMAFARANAKASAAYSPANAEREVSTNTCMRAVNQSIGRAIRHRNDYAVIMLFDQRYEQPSIYKRLPGWIQKSLRVDRRGLEEKMADVKRFFESRS